MGARENAVVRACTAVLDLYGIPWVRLNSGTAWVRIGPKKMRPIALGKTGWPDLLFVCPNGRFGGCECKAPEVPGLWNKKRAGKRSPEQIAVHNMLIRQGALILTVFSSAELVRDLQDESVI
jgi:hypothetical protein